MIRRTCIIGLFFCVLPLFAQNYKKPYQLMNLSEINQLENSLQENAPDLTQIKQKSFQLLETYNGQFLLDKKIEDERREQDIAGLDMNTLRLMILLSMKESDRKYFLGYSPYLYRLHRILGKIYELEGDPYRAVSQYSQALRYTGWEAPYDETIKEQDYPARFFEMARGFSAKDRIEEEQDDEIKKSALRFSEIFPVYQNIVNDYEEALRHIDVVRANRVRGILTETVEEAQSKAGALQNKRDALYVEMKEIYHNSYKKYCIRKSKEDGNVAFRLAVNIRLLEIDHKKWQRVLNRSSFYKGSGTTHGEEKTGLRNFVGYGLFLELASRFDPDEVLYLSMLAEEYRNGKQIDLAIMMLERYILLASKMNPIPEKYSDHVFLLAGLYATTKDYLKSADLYRTALSLVKDPEQILKMKLILADLDFDHTGRLEEAEVYYQDYLAGKLKEESLTEETVPIYFRIRQRLSLISNKFQNSNQEKEHLIKALSAYSILENSYRLAKEEENKLTDRLIELKRKLRTSEDEVLEREYYRLQRIELAPAKERTSTIRTKLDSLQADLVEERLAFLYYESGNYIKAIEHYDGIIKRGRGNLVSLARGNLLAIRMTMQDGIFRKVDTRSRSGRN